MKLLTFFDIYGDNVQLYFDQSSKIKTSFGGLLTIIMIIFILSFSWLIGKDLYYKHKPFYYQQNVILSEYPEIFMNPSSYPLAFSFQDVNANILYDDRYLKLEIIHWNYWMNSRGVFEWNKTSIEFEYCDYSHFPNHTPKSLDAISIQKFFCIKQPYNISLLGYWSESQLSYLEITASLCNGSLRPGYCKNKTEIEEFIASKNINLGLFIVDYEKSVPNFTDPIQPFLVNPYKFLTRDTKYVNFMIQSDTVNTDKGFMFESNFDSGYMRSVELQTESSIFSEESGNYMSYNFHSSNKSAISFRKYIKISEIIASAGGLFNLFSFIFYYINLPICLIKKNSDLIEILFDFKLTKNKDITFYSTLKNLHITKTNLSNMSNYYFDGDKLKNSINNLKKKQTLEISCKEYFEIMCGKNKTNGNSKNDKVNIYAKGQQMIKNIFDLQNIFREIIDLKFIKKIIFTDCQRYFLRLIKLNLENDNFYTLQNQAVNDEKSEKYLSDFLSASESDINRQIVDLITNSSQIP